MSGSVSGYLGFDPTDADSIAASAKIGSYLIGATDGTVIGNVGDALKVSATIDFSYDYAEDSAHSSSDVGAFVLAVRQDTLANSTSADGDYAAFKLNQKGELYVHDTDVLAQLAAGISVTQGTSPWVIGDGGGSITIDGSVSITGDVNVTQGTSPWIIGDGGGSVTVDFTDPDLANTAIENTATAVTDTAAAVVASALANRKDLFLANMGANLVYFGKGTGLTAANGFPIFKNEKLQARIGPSVAPKVICATGQSAEVRVMELS